MATVAAGPPPPFTAETEAFRAEYRAFIDERIRPHIDGWEAAGWFDGEVFGWFAERGWLGVTMPTEYGGLGLGPEFGAVVSEELARCGSGGFAAGIGAHMGIASPPIERFGTPEQKQRWLAPAMRAEKIGALAITEPGGGSDVASARTRAEQRRRRLGRQRREDLHHQRRARGLLRHGGAHDVRRRARRHVLPRHREGRGRLHVAS